MNFLFFAVTGLGLMASLDAMMSRDEWNAIYGSDARCEYV